MSKSLIVEVRAALKERKWSIESVARKFAISIAVVEQIAKKI